MKQWYEELFTNFAKTYDREDFTKGTLAEVDFIESEINHNKSFKILDVGCGTGRHSIELAKRGYSVVGIDLSEDQLKSARQKALKEGVQVDFFQKDARDFSFEQKFDLAIMICEGAFPLMETDEMNFKILNNISNSLSEKGKLILTTLNALFPLFHSVKDFINNNSATTSSEKNSFDLMTFRDQSNVKFTDDDGNEKEIVCNERYYIPSEITWLLKSIGFRKVDIFGCDIGKFSRTVELTPDHFEMLVIAEK